MHPSFPNTIPHESRNVTISRYGGPFQPRVSKARVSPQLHKPGMPTLLQANSPEPEGLQTSEGLCHTTSVLSPLHCHSIPTAAASCSFDPSVSSS